MYDDGVGDCKGRIGIVGSSKCSGINVGVRIKNNRMLLVWRIGNIFCKGLWLGSWVILWFVYKLNIVVWVGFFYWCINFGYWWCDRWVIGVKVVGYVSLCIDIIIDCIYWGCGLVIIWVNGGCYDKISFICIVKGIKVVFDFMCL